MSSFTWLESWGKTPADLGASWDQVDPLWPHAMLLIRAGIQDAKRMGE